MRIIKQLPGRPRFTVIVAVFWLLLASVTAADAAYLQLKAMFAQHLLERAWQQTLRARGKPHHPWSWADTTPVARLKIDTASLNTLVLDGSSGATLAFGPGRVAGSVEPGQRGTIVIGAHRDTHFSNLEHVRVGDRIHLQDRNQNWHAYRITNTTVADTRKDKIVVDRHDARLLLITCYPFDALLPGGPLRYVIESVLSADQKESAR